MSPTWFARVSFAPHQILRSAPSHGISKTTLRVVVFQDRIASPTYATPLKSFHNVRLELNSRIPLVRTSSESAIHCSQQRRALFSSHSHSSQPKPQRTTTRRAVNSSLPYYLALRANPFPEVTDLICRLPLSTLFY